MTDLEEREYFKKMVERFERIEKAIIGDPIFKQRGILDMVYEHGNRLEVLEEFKKKLYWQATAIGGFAAVVIEVLMKIKNYFH